MPEEKIKKQEEATGPRELAAAARISIAGSVLLFLISAAAGILVDSITLILDASASLVILAAALLMRYAVKKIHQPPNDAYHYGYHKYEPLAAVVQRGLIIFTCVISVKYAIQDIVHAEDIKSYGLPVIATFFSGVLGVAVTSYLRRVAKNTNSRMIKAAALHWLSDTVLSFGVCGGFLFGLLMQKWGQTAVTPYVDPVMAIGLALCFVLVPVRGFMSDLLELLDAAPGADIREKVRKAVELVKPRAFGVHRVRTRVAGQKTFVEVCFFVQDSLTVRHADELAMEFERDLKDRIPDCDAVVSFKAHR